MLPRVLCCLLCLLVGARGHTSNGQYFGLELAIDKLDALELRIKALERALHQLIVDANRSSSYRQCRDVPVELRSGVYRVVPEPITRSPIYVYCNHEYNGGGWTVIQNRHNGELNFYRDWQSYRNGFGDLNGEFWLGLENIRLITNSGIHELIVLLKDFAGKSVYARYDQFEVGGEKQQYAITKLGAYTGTAGDSMKDLVGVQFSTFDNDNDRWTNSCAVLFTGAWWYDACHTSNLNGQYLRGKTGKLDKGMVWRDFRGPGYSLKSSTMMIRRKQ